MTLNPTPPNHGPEVKPRSSNLEPGVNLEPRTSNLEPDLNLDPRTSNPAPGSNPNPDTINLLDYLEVLVKHKRTIIYTTVAAFVISIVYSLMLPKIYSATARILPPQQDNSMIGMMGALTGGMAGLAGDLLGKGTTADLYVGILKSEAIKDAIIDRFKLIDIYKKKNRIDTYDTLDKKAVISAGKKDGIISIKVEDKDPKLAADIANAFVEELGNLTVKLNILGAGQNKIYLRERLSKAKVDLVSAEDKLKAFQGRYKLLDVTQQAKASIEGIVQLRSLLAAQEVQLATLSRQFTESSQEVKSLKTSVDNLRRQIARLEGSGAGGAIPNVGSVPELGQEHLRLMRELKVQEAIYEQLTKQFEMTKLTEAKDVSSIQFLQKANIPDKKTKPKRSIIVIVTTFGAFFCSIIITFVLEAVSRMSDKDKNRLKQMLRSQ